MRIISKLYNEYLKYNKFVDWMWKAGMMNELSFDNLLVFENDDKAILEFDGNGLKYQRVRRLTFEEFVKEKDRIKQLMEHG